MCPWYGQINKMAIKSITITQQPEIHAYPSFNDFKSYTGCIFYEMRIYVCNFLLSLEEHLVYYSNEKIKQLLCACFCLTTGLNKFYHTIAKMGIPCIKVVLKEL